MKHIKLSSILLAVIFLQTVKAQPENSNIPEPTQLVINVINAEGFTWDSVQTKHSILYYQPGSETEKKIEEVKSKTEKGLKRALEILHRQNYKSGLRVFFLKDRENQMNEMIGRTVKAMTLFSHDAILMVHNKNVRPYLKHEIFHLISYKELGIPYLVWLREGSAVFADGTCQKFNLDTMGKYLLKSDKLIPLKELTFNFGKYDDIITYLQGGSFVQFIYEKYGLDKIKKLWKLKKEDLESGGLTELEELEKEWKKYLSGLEIDVKEITWKDFQENGCG